MQALSLSDGVSIRRDPKLYHSGSPGCKLELLNEPYYRNILAYSPTDAPASDVFTAESISSAFALACVLQQEQQ